MSANGFACRNYLSSVMSLVCHVSSRPWSLRCASHYWPICHVICIMTTVWDKKFCCCMIPGGSALSRHPCDVAIDVCQWVCMQTLLAVQEFNLMVLCCTSRYCQAGDSSKQMQPKLEFGVWSILCGIKWLGRNGDVYASPFLPHGCIHVKPEVSL